MERVVGRVSGTALPWAMAGVAALIGLPLFFEVGVVLLVPIVLLVSLRVNVPLMKIGIPALAGLSVLHGLVPPHPARWWRSTRSAPISVRRSPWACWWRSHGDHRRSGLRQLHRPVRAGHRTGRAAADPARRGSRPQPDPARRRPARRRRRPGHRGRPGQPRHRTARRRDRGTGRTALAPVPGTLGGGGDGAAACGADAAAGDR
ncbi:hypothetical protein V2I01_20660 [Micromonospora sp. BRA006-A]|nr:hypothetical protein [Micromonospora sp. BRA006-A]